MCMKIFYKSLMGVLGLLGIMGSITAFAATTNWILPREESSLGDMVILVITFMLVVTLLGVAMKKSMI